MVTVCLACTDNSIVSGERKESVVFFNLVYMLSLSILYAIAPLTSGLACINHSNVMKLKGLGILADFLNVNSLLL